MIAVTAVCSYDYCSRKLYLEKVLQLIVENKAALVRGSLHHNCLEALNLAEAHLVQKTTDTMTYQEFAEHFVKKGKSIAAAQYSVTADAIIASGLDSNTVKEEILMLMHTEARQRARDIFSFSELHSNVRGIALWNALDPKRSPEQWITREDLGVRGIIDCLLQFSDGKIIPVEYKTGKAPREGVWPGHRIQVAAYAVMVEREFKKPCNYGIVRYLDHGKEEKVFVNPMLKDEVIGLIDEVQQCLANRQPPPYCGNERKCNSCALKEKCYDEQFIEARLKEVWDAKDAGKKVEKILL